MSKKIAIGGDHAGFEYKTELIKVLETEGYEIRDFGPYSGDSADYPDFVHPLCEAIEKGEFKQGVLICGSGNGVAITANKHQGIRAALCWTEDLASLARQHNDANVLALPARFIPFDLAEKLTKQFLSTDFEGGRHATRVGKIACK
jgi:ribose 5-phosphate isomerase B